MKIAARPLLVLHGNEEFRERVRKVAGKEYTFQTVPDWPSLEEAVRDSPPSALVVVNPYEDSNGRAGPSPSLRSLVWCGNSSGARRLQRIRRQTPEAEKSRREFQSTGHAGTGAA